LEEPPEVTQNHPVQYGGHSRYNAAGRGIAEGLLARTSAKPWKLTDDCDDKCAEWPDDSYTQKRSQEASRYLHAWTHAHRVQLGKQSEEQEKGGASPRERPGRVQSRHLELQMQQPSEEE